MTSRDQRIDAYIAHAPAFATAILERLRTIIHRACPGVVETIKWRMPFFEYQGPLCFFAAFKQHCAFGLWRQRGRGEAGGMGHYGRITALGDLPPRRELSAAIQAAMERNQVRRAPGRRRRAAASGPARSRARAATPAVPDDLKRALATDRAAARAFADFTPGKQRDYISWLEEAKRPATRVKRLAMAVSWIAEGKERNWKYRR